MKLEEVLNIIEVSDDDVEVTDNTSTTDNKKTRLNYSQIIDDFFSDTTSDDSDSLGITDTESTSANISTSLLGEEIHAITDDIKGNSIANSPKEVLLSPKSPQVELNNVTNKNDESSDFDTETLEKCQCNIDTETLVNQLCESCGPLFDYVKYGVKTKLHDWDNVHKLHFIHNIGSLNSCSTPVSNKDDSTTDPQIGIDEDVSNISQVFLKSLGLPCATLEDGPKNKLEIKFRHTLSKPLEELKIFEYGLFPLENVYRLNSSGSEIIISCIASSTDSLIVGTTHGSVFITDLSSYNAERQFGSYNEQETFDSKPCSATWYEIDSQKDVSVTSLDILPNTNWATIGYSNGTVKLIQNSKTPWLDKSYSTTKGEDDLRKDDVPNQQSNSKSLGMMANAVSSAFSGLKKSTTHAVCSTRVFDNAVMISKFTFDDSCEEIICCNKKSVAILTYSKTVLSHSLNVNHLQSLNNRLADSDRILDIVCLSSNPQSKFVTGTAVGGVSAILTLKSCIILSSRPKLSVLFTVSLDKLFNKVMPIDGINVIPSVTWLIFNNGKRNVNPLLLISVGNRVRFILCTTQNAKNAPLLNCANLGTLSFPSKIRYIHMVTRLMFAIMDVDKVLHIVQINLLANPIYYDVIRSVDLNELSINMGLDTEKYGENWIYDIVGNITVHSKTVKMIAKGYKKFANLVADLFQGKKAEASFDLKNISLLVSTPLGIFNIEINSWIKVIGELVASKLFSEAIAIIVALSEEIIPGLFDFTAFKTNISQLLLYTLHQASAHIIKLVKFMNDTQSLSPNLSLDEITNITESDHNWKVKVKTDVENQIKILCNSMIDGCILLQLYDPLNKLVFRCFSTIKLEHIFVKSILLNFYQNRANLTHLDSQVLESILDTYDNVLDYIVDKCMIDIENAEDLILFLDEMNLGGSTVCLSQKEASDIWKSSGLSGYNQLDPILLIYNILSNNLVSMQLFCFKNKILIDANKALCRLSKHHLWHALMYCQSDMAEDISVLMNIYISEALDKCRSIGTTVLSPDTSVTSSIDLSNTIEYNPLLYIVPFETSEKRFIIRVLFLTLNTFLTFGNSGMETKLTTEYYRNIISFLLSSSSQEVNVELPITSKFVYATRVPQLKDVKFDYSNFGNERFGYDPRTIDDTFIMYNLMVLSPRLLFVCFANLFINCDEYFESNEATIGSKIETFNFFLSNIIPCIYKLESSVDDSNQSIEFIRNIKTMLAILILGTTIFTENFFLDHRTQTLAIHSLLDLNKYHKNAVVVNDISCSSSELTNTEGFFNNRSYHNIFSKKKGESTNLRDIVLKMYLTEDTLELLTSYIQRSIYFIYSTIDRNMNLSDDSNFINIMEICKNFTCMAKTKNIKLLLCEVSAKFESIFKDYGSSGEPSSVFLYIEKLIEYMKMDTGSSFSPENVTQLLISDVNFRKKVVIAVMDNLPMLINLDLSRVTSILAKLFSLTDIMKIFNEDNLETFSDMLLNTLSDVPDLQLLVLDSFLRSNTISDEMNNLSNSYFDKYLKLLSLYEKSNVCEFLKTQKILNITYCLNVCKENSIEDAVIYLLIRAGNIEEATVWLLKSFTRSINADIDLCFSIVETSSNLCKDHEMQLSHETVERFWFTVLEVTIFCYKENLEDLHKEKICALIEKIFTMGILRFVNFRVTLTKIIEYDSLLVFFRLPLHNLISDYIMQTFMADNAVSISKDSLNNEFKEGYLFSNRGIVISTSNRMLRTNKPLICPVCKEELGPSIMSGVGNGQKKHTKQGSKSRFKGSTSQTTHANNITPFEQKIGVVVNVPIYGVKNKMDEPSLPEQTISVKNLYNDRLSTFARRNSASKTDSEAHKSPALTILDQRIKRGFGTNLQAEIPVKVFWCKHAFHQECAPTTCPICTE
ncbi:hypothetical protein BEWA_031980 [Theileria equi strain WA]|uniref:Vacuolar protein sorting-associated protein 8 central domain-containing protein n=1 Tax=Theileria equi strain WA TaxID=1537102 RepID=L0AXQ6_THEEQ|nr:hypothetical protein BEWA_031980 [Theileria equi strain WA]AFZ80345.1 hypothetical protein BEWA_031980 [Theileria equi strain WA]|eukprot:XP_004830011.1 hypothetical protein BEWA_031980 [Theileria equi strain WA]